MNSNQDRDEQRLAELLSLAGEHIDPPDEEFLRRLGQRSAAEFTGQPVVEAAERAEAPEVASRIAGPTAERRRRMLLLVRGLTAALAASILVVAALWNGPGATGAAPTLGKVLEAVAAADSLHLQLSRGGKTGEVWVRQPQQLRANRPDGTYEIARDGRVWDVDEKANRATSRPATYFRDQPEAGTAGLDPLALLDISLDKDQQQALLALLPAERADQGGRECYVYRIRVPWQAQQVELEALVDAGTQFLHSLQAKTPRDGQLEPLSKLTVLGRGEPVAEDLFVVGDTLTEDGRIGKVIDAQGIVTVRPVMHERWTPVDRRMLVMPGDWLRTDPRGANAVTLRLVPQTDVTLGPGSLVECVSPRRLRIAAGELKIVAAAKAALEIVGPGQKRTEVHGTAIFRVAQEKEGEELVRLEQVPPWLRGYEGRTADESIGSLVATIDGRNEPLTVGYHKVSVDIRDQIARTVIEESFVNHTSSRLEGVFHFPLPEDASISGFGMWIGDKLVEADIVEKQRAREIYETILREQRDPGLLEWTGGNIFKARVFPIEANSEKRIRISYTQVLSLRGNRYRYQYALQSELLKRHPLRELGIDVKIHSAVPLQSVTCPTHSVRSRQTGHSAQVEFAAQEHTPTRDFEIVVQIDRRQADVVMIPHRRGDDGYFMLQLTPPASNGQWDRDVVADGEPLELLILADTSASIDPDARARQAEIVAALLSSLSPKDRFNLATCDVDCHWAFEQAMPAEEKHVGAARQLLLQRGSLGWTDLDKALASAIARCGPKTQVVYLGDGIVTTGDQDAVALAKRSGRLHEGKGGTFHAITLGSSFEPVVMKAIASLGGGSLRQITGEQRPASAAKELLAEIAQPGLRDIQVEFRGLRTARVYPAALPNLPLGRQQILLGRYLPQGGDQAGEVVVRGALSGKTVRYSRPVSLKDAEQGNSFIPRLWARMHLDALLQQGTSQSVIDDIIALSEEYNIITPYTSMLVLDSDSDRERFKVKSRFRMRDGEKFFAEGRANVDYDLVQQQMRQAGLWRIGIRRAVQQQLANLGRDAQFVERAGQADRGWQLGVEFRSPVGAGAAPASDLYMLVQPRFMLEDSSSMQDFDSLISLTTPAAVPSPFIEQRLGDKVQGRDHLDFFDSRKQPVDEANRASGAERWDIDRDFAGAGESEVASESYSSEGDSILDPMSAGSFGRPARPSAYYGRFRAGQLPFLGVAGGRFDSPERLATRVFPVADLVPPAAPWLNHLFPQVPQPPGKPKEPKKAWPEAARQLARSLLRTEQVRGFQGGLRIDRQADGFDPRWGEVSRRSRLMTLVSPNGWLTRSESDGTQAIVSWCDGKVRGVFGTAFQLGRQRNVPGTRSVPDTLDLRMPPLQLEGYAIEPLDRTFQGCEPEVKPQQGNRTLLVLRDRRNRRVEWQILIDTARKVVLRTESRQDGKTTSTTRFDDFVEVGGAWYAGRIETFDGENRLTSRVIEKFQPLTAGQWDPLWKGQMDEAAQVQFLHEPLPSLLDARKHIAAGRASLEDHLVMTLHFQRSQQWARVMDHWQKAEQVAGAKPGLRWVRDALLDASRRREELRIRRTEEATRLARNPAAGPALNDRLFLAEHLLSQSGNSEASEMLALLDLLKPVVERAPAHLKAMKNWLERRAGHLQTAGQWDNALAVRRQLAEHYPHDHNLQRSYAQALAETRDYAAAYDWIAKVVAPGARWLPNEEESLRDLVCGLLRQQAQYFELAEYLAGWLKLNPPSQSPYQQYLGALVFTDRFDEADSLAARWLDEAQKAAIEPQEGNATRPRPALPTRTAAGHGIQPPDAAARLRAAIAHMVGQGQHYSRDRMDPKWLKPLAAAALVFARHDETLFAAREIMGNGQFGQSDSGREVRRTIAKFLREDFAPKKAAAQGLSLDQIAAYIEWISSNDPAVEPELWKKIAAGLRQRWSKETDQELRNRMAGMLTGVLSAHATAAELLQFLRAQIERAPEEYRAGHVRQLFNTLLGQPWSAEYENEALGLLEQLSDAEEAAQRVAVQVASLQRLADRMVQARFEARLKTIQRQEKLTRQELATKRAECLKAAREGFADRLREEARKRQPPLSRWMTIERVYWDVIVGRDLDQAEGDCWELLPADPSSLKAHRSTVEATLENRCLVTLLNLAARKTARPALVDRLLKYLDKAISADSEDVGWRLFKVQLLIALDRPQALQRLLEVWVQEGDAGDRWRQALAYLLAEQGRLEPAIRLFEGILAGNGLGPTDHRVLADWYMALGRKEDHRRAMIAVYATVEEWQLNNRLWNKVNQWRRSDQPPAGQLDDEVFLSLAALFQKSSHPQNYIQQLAELYRLTRDFRLLEGLADAVVGHTAGEVYPFLQALEQVLREIQDEATADSLVARIAKVREGGFRVQGSGFGGQGSGFGVQGSGKAGGAGGKAQATRPSSRLSDVDQRALDLLEVFVQRRAAELKNEPGPHGDRALSAMKRAFGRAWSPGEPRLAADFLSGLGTIAYQPLADEQVGQLEALHRQTAASAVDRLHIAHALARCHWNYGRRPRAIDILESGLAAHQAAMGGSLPAAANPVIETFISYLEEERHFARGEQYLQEQIRRASLKQQVYWFGERLYRLYARAVQDRGDVSLGSGRTLYRAVEAKLLSELDTPDENHLRALLGCLWNLYRAADSRNLGGVLGDFETFVFGPFPALLRRRATNHYQHLVDYAAQTGYALAGPDGSPHGPREGLKVLLTLIDKEPRWLEYVGQTAWSRHGHRLAEWRWQLETKGGELGDLDGRLLKIVLAELRRDLETRRQNNGNMYWQGHTHFWAAKKQEFVSAATSILTQNRQSGASVVYITQYLYRGLGQHAIAVDALLDAHRREVLDEGGQSQLVQFAHEQQRYAETIPVLEPLVERRADHLPYRIWLMRAYWGTRQQARLVDLLKRTDAYFHEKDRWQESVLASLAQSCLENELYLQSAAYYKELIPLHQRTQPNRGVGNGTLSGYYANQARAYAGLGKTAEAVDAACGAVVSWGRNAGNRAGALQSLRDVLKQSSNLDAYVAQLDKETAASRQDRPIVRKALGQVYQEKGEFAKAIRQLDLAAEFQSNDAEIYRALIDCYDRQQDRDGAIRQILRSLVLLRRDIARYRDLGQRLEAVGRRDEAERAFTSIVEVLPHESEGHAMLAELRQQQNRWPDAIVHWEQVARIRALEPTGLLNLAAAQIHQSRWSDAAATLARLRARSWPARFADVPAQIRNLEQQIQRKP